MPRAARNPKDESRDELGLLEAIRRRAGRSSSPALRLGIGDDCALLRPRRGEELAVTTDLSLEGRHFRIEWNQPEAVGHRTLARGLSDLAAMGARPLAAFLSLGLPRALTEKRRGRPAWIERFYDGFFALAEATRTPLAGGDLAESPLAVADIVLIGAVPEGRSLVRAAARPGDRIYVTGQLGGAAAGLQALEGLLSSGKAAPARLPQRLAAPCAPFLKPQPRLAQGQALLRRRLSAAALDMSDGLSIDLAHLCEESRVSAEIESALLPIAPGATLAQALHGGEDYELLFTAPPTVRMPRALTGVPLSCIGQIVKRAKGRHALTLLGPQGPEPLLPQGWRHFIPR